ncbi:hypothetical protein HK099_002634 [Clydaea vesicula]|uniref:Radical SAM core domain-containing protein n=1 Tax=Clydaea vesicula TaxID=447962 RepID=A0AAD5TT65_9FUNG|nr:hypothetical protein HK099_002634 [Clydaea vesicula]
MNKLNLLAMTKPELYKVIPEKIPSMKKFNINQIQTHIFKHGRPDIERFVNLSMEHRNCLNQHFEMSTPILKDEQISKDGTKKWLLNFGGDADIETVFIPDSHSKKVDFFKGTLCVSSQIGCSLNCSFCRTGTQKLMRNLQSHEIINQVLFALRQLGGFPLPVSNAKIVDNIVLMGQGEPLYNFANVSKACRSIIENLNYSPYRITLSTSGVAPLIPKVTTEIGCSLAVSLHAPNDSLRDVLVPINKTYPLKILMTSIQQYLRLHQYNKNRRVTFEYVMLDGVNDSDVHAKELIQLVGIEEFAAILRSANIATTVRVSRGSDISAACGQLKSKNESKYLRNK